MPIEQIKPNSWNMRRHSYGPEHIGLTDPPDADIQKPGGIDQSNLCALINRNNELLDDLIRLNFHTNVTEYDIDISDSITYDLGPSEGAIIYYKVPTDYVMLLRMFSSRVNIDTNYFVYIDDEIYQYIPEMAFPGIGIPIASEHTFKMYILNMYNVTQSYTTYISACVRRAANWEYPVYSYKVPI